MESVDLREAIERVQVEIRERLAMVDHDIANDDANGFQFPGLGSYHRGLRNGLIFARDCVDACFQPLDDR